MSKFNSNIGKERIRSIIKMPGAHVHFLGAGGVGMFSLFKLTADLGISASGSDRRESRYTELLKRSGARIFTYHEGENAEGADLLVYTLAADDRNPELRYARSAGIPLASRAEYLGAVSEFFPMRICVSGSHGKSTVTAMLSSVLSAAGLAPTVLCGADMPPDSLPYKRGGEECILLEACEYKDSFLSLSPTTSVFTNLELDHVDYFKDLDSIKSSFCTALNMPALSVINSDSENLSSLIKDVRVPYVSCGASSSADFKIADVTSLNGLYSFKILHGGSPSPVIRLSVPGAFNVENAALAYAAAVCNGSDPSVAARALSEFSGVGRRLEHLGELRGAEIYYDYAHHPTEIKAGIDAVREMRGGSVAVVFKPHTYSRTAGLFSNFASALSRADRVMLLDIDPIREERMDGVSSERLAASVGAAASVINDDNILENILKTSCDSVIIMGAADIDISEIKRMIKDV